VKYIQNRDREVYEYRVNGEVMETSANSVNLYWKARRRVNGDPDVYAVVECIEGPIYVECIFSNATLYDWERT